MKKLLLTAVLLSVLTSAWSFDYFESNILGMKLGPVLESPPGNAEYVLRIVKTGGKEVQILFKGAEIYFTRTIEKSGGQFIETTEKADLIQTIVREKGLILSEEKAEEGRPVELSQYYYKGGRLESTVFSSGNEILYTEVYKYTADNRLLDVRRVYQDGGEGAISSFVFIGGKIRNYWSDEAGGQSIIKFDNEGIFFSQIISDENWSETREYGRDETGRRFELISNEKGEKIRLLYNKSGSLVSSTSYDSEGHQAEQLLYRWDGELLVHLTVKKALSIEKFSYGYDRNGMLLNETYEKNGSIIQETIYYDGENWVEKLYRYGKPILRITYRDGQRVDTEQLQDE